MTNFQIITNAIIDAGLMTKNEVEELIKNKKELPYHTFADWKNRGYKIKKGEHAKLTALIWKRKMKKKTDIEFPEELGEEISDINEEEDTGRFFKTKAFFFDETQVEEMKATA